MSRKYHLREKSKRGTPYGKEEVGTYFVKHMLGGIARITIVKLERDMVEYTIQGVKVVKQNEPRRESFLWFKRYINTLADATRAERWAAGL